MIKVFARKLIRLSGNTTRNDIEREATAIARLCRPGESVRVVLVLQHGWLPHNPSCYYIDMDYCPQTLEQYIKSRNGSPLACAGNTTKGEILIWRELLAFNFNLAFELALGLHYIHKNGITHRDLNPRNSIDTPGGRVDS